MSYVELSTHIKWGNNTTLSLLSVDCLDMFARAWLYKNTRPQAEYNPRQGKTGCATRHCHFEMLQNLASMARPAPRPATHIGVTRRHRMWPPGAKSNTQTHCMHSEPLHEAQRRSTASFQTPNTNSNRSITGNIQRDMA